MKYDSPVLLKDTAVAARSGEPAVLRRRHIECRVCLGQHDEGIHSATLSVHQWFRNEVIRCWATPEELAARAEALWMAYHGAELAKAGGFMP